MRRVPSHQLGSYVLEVAGVVMGLAVFIVGAADVTRIFQARSAVRAAVNEGARCLYPTDAGCVAHAPNAISAPARTFDVWVWGAGYEVAQESYVASAQWRQEPVYEAVLQRDEITEVTVEQDKFQYRPYSVLFPTTAHAPYLLQTKSLPVVDGGSPLSPSFVDPVSSARSRPNATYSLSKVEGVTTAGVNRTRPSSYHDAFKIGSVSFPVQGAWPTMQQDVAQIATLPATVQSSLDCYSGALRAGNYLDWSARLPTACRYRESQPTATTVMKDGALRVPLAFRVTGSSRGTETRGEGKVVMALSWRSPTASLDGHELGGRRIVHLGGGNFVPRGLAKADIQKNLWDQYEDYNEELAAYYELPLIPIDATVTIEFYLVSFNGDKVAWSGGTLEVWHPQYRFVHERHDCGSSLDPTLCATPPTNVTTRYVALTEGGRFSASPTGSDTCSLEGDTSAEKYIGAVLARLESDAQLGKTLAPQSFRLLVPTNKTVCASDISNRSCEYQSEEYLQGCQPSRSADEIASWCGVTALPGAAVRVASHSVRSSPTGMQRVRACSDQPLPQCSRSYAREVDTVMYSGSASCDAARVTTTPQLVVGPLYANLSANGCEAREPEVQALYRTTHKVPLDATISVVKLPAPPLFSAERPQGACIPFQAAEGSSRELVCGKGISSSAAERCCAASNQRCRKQPIIHQADNLTGGERSSILEAAQQRVIEAVQAGYPAAHHQSVCGASDPDCLEVATSLIEGDSKAVVSARVQVPLHLLSSLIGSIETVEHSSTRQLERSAL